MHLFAYPLSLNKTPQTLVQKNLPSLKFTSPAFAPSVVQVIAFSKR